MLINDGQDTPRLLVLSLSLFAPDPSAIRFGLYLLSVLLSCPYHFLPSDLIPLPPRFFCPNTLSAFVNDAKLLLYTVVQRRKWSARQGRTLLDLEAIRRYRYQADRSMITNNAVICP